MIAIIKKILMSNMMSHRKLIAAVKNGDFDEAFRVHQEVLWLVTHKLAKVRGKVCLVNMIISLIIFIVFIFFLIGKNNIHR